MAIIKPKFKDEKSAFRIKINSQIFEEIKQYCEFAGFKKYDEFFEEAAVHILSKDKDFKEWKETRQSLEKKDA